MNTYPTPKDDIIDSRDVIAAVEELQAYAEELQMNYANVEFAGVTYWVR